RGLKNSQPQGDHVRLGRDPGAGEKDGLGGVLQIPAAGSPGGGLARHRLRPVRRRACALRAHRKRASHQASGSQDQTSAGETAGLAPDSKLILKPPKFASWHRQKNGAKSALVCSAQAWSARRSRTSSSRRSKDKSATTSSSRSAKSSRARRKIKNGSASALRCLRAKQKKCSIIQASIS